MTSRCALLVALLLSSCMPGNEACRQIGEPIALDDSVREASGVAVSRRYRDVLWVHNDSRGATTLFALDTEGRPLGSVSLAQAQNRDWEDVAIARCPDGGPHGDCLFVADIGDNRARRDGIGLWVVAEPDPRTRTSAEPVFFRLHYPDGARDAEALVVRDDGSFLVVTKGREFPVTVFAGGPLRWPASTAEPLELRRVQQLTDDAVDLPLQITGGGTDGNTVALRSYSVLSFFRVAGDTLEPLALTPVRLDSLAPEPQGEGVTLGRRGRVYLVSEAGPQAIAPRLTRLRCRLP